MNSIRIALTKGRLEQKSVALFEKAGFDCENSILQTELANESFPFHFASSNWFMGGQLKCFDISVFRITPVRSRFSA